MLISQLVSLISLWTYVDRTTGTKPARNVLSMFPESGTLLVQTIMTPGLQIQMQIDYN